MNEIIETRKIFCHEFYQQAENMHVRVLEDRMTDDEALIWENAICFWESDSYKRSITLEKSDEDTRIFDGFLKSNTGVNDEIVNLYLMVYEPLTQINNILHLYDLWMNKKCTVVQIEVELISMQIINTKTNA